MTCYLAAIWYWRMNTTKIDKTCILKALAHIPKNDIPTWNSPILYNKLKYFYLATSHPILQIISALSMQNKYSSSLHTLFYRLPIHNNTILEDVLIHKSDFSTASGFMPSQAASPNTLQKKHVFEQEVSYRYRFIVVHQRIHLVTQTCLTLKSVQWWSHFPFKNSDLTEKLHQSWIRSCLKDMFLFEWQFLKFEIEQVSFR